MRAPYLLIGIVSAFAFAIMFAAGSGAASDDVVVPALLGLCFATSVSLALFGTKRQG
jgi:hypothetical protein